MAADPNLKIEEYHVLQFSTNVEMLLQQKAPRLAGTTDTGSYTGEKAQPVNQLGQVEMNPILAGTAAGQWMGDTVWSDIEHHQRWLAPEDFALALPLARQDQIRMLIDPKGGYAEAVRAAYARKHDDIIIAAATGDALIGKHGTATKAFPATQVIPAGGTGMTIAKLLEAKKMLIAAGNDPNEERFIALSEQQLLELLQSSEVQSIDYNTVKALVKGEVDSFVGFKFISTERLKLDGTTRQCLAWVKSGLHFGMWDPLNVKADQRLDKNYVWQIYARASIAATRTQEEKVVRIDCAE